jgi:hypothetical protein
VPLLLLLVLPPLLRPLLRPVLADRLRIRLGVGARALAYLLPLLVLAVGVQKLEGWNFWVVRALLPLLQGLQDFRPRHPQSKLNWLRSCQRDVLLTRLLLKEQSLVKR